jgi:hypothetical protein
MLRYSAAHPGAEREVFPLLGDPRPGVLAFTATRWGTLLKRHPLWNGDPPSAAECYRYCLAEPAVHIVLTAP